MKINKGLIYIRPFFFLIGFNSVFANDGKVGRTTGRSGFHSGSSVIIVDKVPACMSTVCASVIAVMI
mgnify:CR=1 FL=1